MSNKTTKGQNTDYFVAGRNAVREVLKHKLERVQSLVVASNSSALNDVRDLAASNNILIEECEVDHLDELTGFSNHQSVALRMKCSPLKQFKEVKAEFQAMDSALVLALDGVEDPQNLGSIIRVAECFQVSAVLWSSNRGAPLTTTVTKVSVGATELVPLIAVRNLRTALSQLKAMDFWLLATSVSDVSSSIYEFEFPAKAVLILGSEQKGVSRLILEESDYQLAIPMHGKIDSLNVAQSTAVLLAEWRRNQ